MPTAPHLIFPLFTLPFWLTLRRMSLTDQMVQLARQAKSASRQLAILPTADKNRCLGAMADALEQNASAIK